MLLSTFISKVALLAAAPTFVYAKPTETIDKRVVSAVSQINQLFSGETNQSTYQAVFGILDQLSPTTTLSTIPRKLPSFSKGS